MQPADAVFLEELVPVDITGLHAGGGGVAAVVKCDAAALGDADFCEVQPDAIFLADAVVLALDDVIDRHSDSAGMVANGRAHRRAVQSADPTRSQPQPRQRIGDIVFSAAHPDLQHRRELDPTMLRRRQTDHALAQRDQIETAIRLVADFEHCVSSRVVYSNLATSNPAASGITRL